MEDRSILYSWEGRRVVASIVTEGEYNQNLILLPLRAPELEGTLEQVSELGIVASLEEDPDQDEAVSTFYPWSAVLFLRPKV